MTSERRYGLGLRAQIVAALSAAFVASFTLLGIAAVQITHRGRALEQRRQAESTLGAVAIALESAPGDRRATLARLGEAMLGRGAVAGIEVARPGLEADAIGEVTLARPLARTLRDGSRLRMFLRPPDPAASTTLTNLLLMYVAFTAGAILLLAYVALTYLIVRPVEAVTRASERLAAGSADAVAPVGGAAEVARLGVSFNDMAAQLRRDRSALEARLRELEARTRELKAAQDQVVRSERLASVGRLAAGVAHEIGNPLAAILGLVELLRDGGLDADEESEFLRRIHHETERINGIIRDLLGFARDGDGAPGDARRAECDVRDVVEDAVRLIVPQKDLHSVTIERRFDGDLPSVGAGSDRLTQIVLNLLLNAADAVSDDGAILVEVTHDTARREVVLAVSDSGPGIAAEALEHVFEPFFTTKPVGTGTGLGLAVCHNLVERLGGSIRASNQPQGGARFEVRLPAATASSPEASLGPRQSA